MDVRAAARRTVPILLTAALLAACSSGGGSTAAEHPGGSGPQAASAPTPSTPSTPSASAPAVGSAAASGRPSAAASSAAAPDYPTSEAAPGAAVPQVRDALAVLRATYNDGCTTPGNCEYFLTRVLTNLDDLYDSMRADPKGGGHFAAPVGWIHALQESLDGDYAFPNLKRHQKDLLNARDEVNTWMQSHPDDYR